MMAYVTRKGTGATIGSFLLRFLFIVVLAGTLMYLLNRKTANTYFAQFGSQTGNNVNGTWIGVLDSYDYPLTADQLELNPDLAKRKPVKLRATILINVHLTDAHMESYEGDGLFYTQGAMDLRTLTHVEFDNPNGVFTGEVATRSVPRGSGHYDGYQNIKGSFSGGTLDLSDMNFGSYGFHGKLHHATRAEYLQLCQQLGLNKSLGKE